MVEEINPTYYAAGLHLHKYTLTGSLFMSLPADAVALPSNDNEDPLKFRYYTGATAVMNIESRTDNEITFSAEEESVIQASYIGCILSNDREVVYWVNNTRPLP